MGAVGSGPNDGEEYMKFRMIVLCAYITGAANGALAIEKQTVINAVSTGDLKFVTNYLVQGGDVNARDDFRLRGYTLLMYAVRAQNPDICRVLLNNGAHPDDRSRAGETAVNMASLIYEVTLPCYHEKRIAKAEKELETVAEKYKESTRKRIDFYKKQFKEADTSEQAQQRAKQIVDMLKSNPREIAEPPTENVSILGTNNLSAPKDALRQK